jgi:hypothetical protein
MCYLVKCLCMHAAYLFDSTVRLITHTFPVNMRHYDNCNINIIYLHSRAQAAVTLTRAFRRNSHNITRMWAPEWVCLIFNMWHRLTAFKSALKKGLQPPDYGYTVSTSTYTYTLSYRNIFEICFTRCLCQVSVMCSTECIESASSHELRNIMLST